MNNNNISLSYILQTKNSKVNEEFIWCVLSESIETIQKSNFIEQEGFFLMTPNNTYISSSGKIIFIRMNEYNKVYCSSNIQNLEQDWYKMTYNAKLQIILFSLGKMLKLLVSKINDENSIKSKELLSIITQLTELNNDSTMMLSDIQLACNLITKDFLIKDRLLAIYQENSCIPNGMRSLSTSSLDFKFSGKTYARTNSVSSRNNYENLNISRNGSRCYETASVSSNTSETKRNSHPLSDSKNGHIYMGRMDNYVKPNIPAAMERLKAQRKVSKPNGPVKSPGIQADGLISSHDFEKMDQQRSLSSQNLPFIEMSNIERLNGERRFIGPEFIIRKNETFNVSSNLQRRNSIFNRTDTIRNFNCNVQVHLLNGVSLFIKNLSKQSIISHVINAVHSGYPDLEFVNYGLYFKLDDEYFFLKEDINVQKLSEYVIRKTQKNSNENKKNLHLYYRIKFYPTLEIIDEMNSFNHKLFYLQLRHDLLYTNNPPINLSESLVLAGIAIQAEYGYNINNMKENLEYFSIDFYLHKYFHSFLDTSNPIQFLKSLQQPWNEMPWENCEYLFVEKVFQHKFFGIHWYRVNKNQFDIIDAIGKNTYLAVSRDFIQLLDTSRSDKEIQIHKHFCYKWRQIESISIKHKKILIKPKMQLKIEGINSINTTSAFVCYVDSKTKAEHIVNLCNEHHLLASQNEESENNYASCQSLMGSHRRLSAIDYPSSLRASFSFGEEENTDTFFDNSMSEDEMYQNSKSSLSLNKKLIIQSMNDLSYSRPKNTNDVNINKVRSINYENFKKSSRRSPMKLDLKPAENDANFFKELLEVEINHENIPNKNLGIGIIKIQTQNYEGMFIKRILKDSPIDKCGRLKIGDEIVFINNQFVSNLTQSEIGNIIKHSEKSIKFLIRKHLNLEDNQKPRSIQKASSFTQINNSKPTIESFFSASKQQKFNIINIQTIQQLLKSNKTFSFFEKSAFNKIFPIIKLSNEQRNSQILKANFDDIFSKEICLLKKKLLNKENHIKEIISTSSNGYNQETNIKLLNKFDIYIKAKDLLFGSTQECGLNDLFFSLIPIKHRIDPSCWKYITKNSYKLIFLFINFHQNGVSIIQQISNVLNIKFSEEVSVSIVEIHEFSNSIKFLRLNLNIYETESSQTINHRIFVIVFNSWNDKMKDFELNEHILQTINVACSMNENLSNYKLIILYCEEMFQKIGMFITLYSFILFGIHKKLPIFSPHKSQTIFYMISNQIGDQISELIPNENQYEICIFILKQLISPSNRADSFSDTSDVN